MRTIEKRGRYLPFSSDDNKKGGGTPYLSTGAEFIGADEFFRLAVLKSIGIHQNSIKIERKKNFKKFRSKNNFHRKKNFLRKKNFHRKKNCLRKKNFMKKNFMKKKFHGKKNFMKKKFHQSIFRSRGIEIRIQRGRKPPGGKLSVEIRTLDPKCIGLGRHLVQSQNIGEHP